MNECCNFHDLCELWNAHFDTMISCVSLLVMVFGLVIPTMAAWFQHKRLKYERDRWDKDMERRLADFEKQKERIVQQNLRIDELQDLLGNAYVALAQFYLNEAGRVSKEWPTAGDKDEKTKNARAVLKYVGSTLQCVLNSRNRSQTIVVLKTFVDAPPIFLTDGEILNEAMNSLCREYPRSTFFVKSADLAEIVGADNQTYKDFCIKFKPVFDLTEEFYSA